MFFAGKPGMTVYGRIASKQPLKPHTFNVGDRVRFTLPDDILKDLLRGHGEWHPNLIPVSLLRHKRQLVYSAKSHFPSAVYSFI